MIIIIVILIVVSIELFYWFSPTFGQNFKKKRTEKIEQSLNFRGGKFQNLVETPVQAEGFKFREVFWEFMFKGKERRPEKPIETINFDKNSFVKADSGIAITWFGHSTALIRIDGYSILFDPVFSKRTSPVSFAGTKSFDFTKAYDLSDLPELNAIIITHDHYDHLDYKTIKKLKEKNVKFYVPLGVAAHLEKWGVRDTNIVELDWWENAKFDDNLILRATPSRHFSGRRGMTNKTLWCSWVIKTDSHSVFFSGDSGYGDHFGEIGEKCGPFNVTMLECGQYNEGWPYIHMMPEQTVQANIDLNGDVMIPIHWGRFNLSLHSWTEPAERVAVEAKRKNINILIPQIGEIYFYGDTMSSINWWADKK
ncbi:MBL fold metallo-hydrolase [Bacteroidota bacterium]